MRNPHDENDPLQGHLFWSRAGGRDLSAEVDYNRPCPVCGYNLRGMPMKRRCPECGSIGGWNLYDEPVAWEDAQSLSAFVSTTYTSVFHPHLLARHVWRPARMDVPAARRYRRIALTIASISLIIAALAITSQSVGWPAALFSLPFQAAAIIVWLNTVTIEPMSRMKDWSGNSVISRRVQAIVHYTSAPLVLSPLHVAIALALYNFNVPWFLSAGLHIALLIVQLSIASLALGWLLYELVDMPAIQAQTMSLAHVVTATASAAVVLYAVPATVALLASKIIGP